MGYTHYWRYKSSGIRTLEGATEMVARDLAVLLPALPPLAGPGGDGDPILYQDIIAFNGPRPHDYESFYFSPGDPDDLDGDGFFGFTKTGPSYEGRCPYDLAVMVALTLLCWHAPNDIKVSSDGNLMAWEPATRLVAKKLGYPVDPFYVLERGLWLLEDARRRRFLIEVDPGASWEKEVEHLAYLHRIGLSPYAPPYAFLDRVDDHRGYRAEPGEARLWHPVPTRG